MAINVYLSSLIICDIQAELNFCDIEMGDLEKIKGCKGSCQVKFFMILNRPSFDSAVILGQLHITNHLHHSTCLI